jgi:hypothetical protein
VWSPSGAHRAQTQEAPSEDEQECARSYCVFQEADTVIFNGTVLWVGFPDDADFHAREARKSRHVEALKEVVEAMAGTRPKDVFIEP